MPPSRNTAPVRSDVIISPGDVRRIRRRILKWGRANFRPYPWRNPAEPWHGLIAELLLQRTRATNAVSVYQLFINSYPNPGDLARAPVKEIEKIIFPLGLRWRAPLLKKLGEELNRLGGTPPSSLDLLLELPGVGPYAAAAWLSFHGGRRGVIVDANVVRWICRMVGRKCDAETRRKRWLIQLADRLTPSHGSAEYNYAVLDFTMEICATRPKCVICPVGPRLCAYGKKALLMEND